MNNSRWKSIQSWQELEIFIANNPTWLLIDTGNKENRYYMKENGKGIGISVDGRSVKVLFATGKVKIHSI